jgi:hypothetical protein
MSQRCRIRVIGNQGGSEVLRRRPTRSRLLRPGGRSARRPGHPTGASRIHSGFVVPAGTVLLAVRVFGLRGAGQDSPEATA